MGYNSSAMSLFVQLKDHVVPHAGNGFRPKILEFPVVLVVIFALLGLKGVSLVSFTRYLGGNVFNQIAQTDLYTLTNETRSANKLTVLKPNSALEVAAQLKLQDMVAHDYFAHVSPKGVQPWNWFDVARYQYQIAGENLAMDFTSSQEVMNAWINSPDHRKNILLPEFTDIGIAVGTGIINGQQRTIVVEELGTPQKAATVVARPPAPLKAAPMANAKTTTSESTSSTVAVAFRSQPSQPLAAVSVKEIPPAPVSQTPISKPSIPVAWTDMIFIIFALFSVGVFLTNILVARHVQFPDLIGHSALVAGIAIVAWLMNDASLLSFGHHIIVP